MHIVDTTRGDATLRNLHLTFRSVSATTHAQSFNTTTKNGPGWKSIEFNSTQIHRLKPLALVIDNLTEHYKLESSGVKFNKWIQTIDLS